MYAKLFYLLIRKYSFTVKMFHRFLLIIDNEIVPKYELNSCLKTLNLFTFHIFKFMNVKLKTNL